MMPQRGSPPAMNPVISAPPQLAAAPHRGRGWWLLGLAGAVALAWVLFRFNPAEGGFYPRCALHSTTGLLCPGCGGLRASHQLLHGEVREAFVLNPLAVVLLPMAVALGLEQLLRSPQERRLASWFTRPLALVAGAGLLFGFSFARNLPLAEWLGF